MSMSEKLNTLDVLKRYQNKDYLGTSVGISAIHENINVMREKIDHDLFDQYYKVAFVRNPWDWLVSYYSYYKKTDIRRVGVLIDGQYIFGDSAINKIGASVAEKRNLKNVSFQDFLHILEEESRFYHENSNLNQIDYPYHPQYKYLVDENDEIVVNFVGKYESIKTDWNSVCERLELRNNQFRRIDLPHHNRSSHKDYRAYYDDADAERVYNIYKKDIELFDYSF